MKSRKILSTIMTFAMVISLLPAVSITASAASMMDYVITNNSAVNTTFDVIETSSSTVVSTGAAFSVALAACTDDGTDSNLVIKFGDSESSPLVLSETFSEDDHALRTATYMGYVDIQRNVDISSNIDTYGLSVPSGSNVILNNLIIEDTGTSDSILSAAYVKGGTLTIDGNNTSLKVNGQYDTALDIGSGNVTVNSGSLTSLGSASNTIKQIGGTLTINGGTITGEGDDVTSAVVKVNSETDCSTTISGSTIISGAGLAIYTDHEGGNGTVTIAGGTITGNEMGVSNSGNTVNISGGTITATASFTVTNMGGTLNISGGTIEAKGSFGTIGSRSASHPAVTTISGNAKLKSDSGNIIYMLKNPIPDTQTANIFGKTVSSDDNAVIMVSGSGGDEINKDTYGTFRVFAGDLEEAFTGWASDSVRTNIISTVNPDTINNLTTGANSAVTNIYLKTGTATTVSAIQPAGTGADANNPYLITTAGHLLWMSQNCTTQSGFTGKYFKQTANIDLTGLGEFVPIGSMAHPFKGYYDGNNHNISKLYIHGSYSETGLFGDLKEGTIKNLTLEDVSISGNNWAVAGFVGYLESTGTVANCHITKSNGGSSLIEGTYPGGGGSAIGGIAGENDGTIEYCSNAADITNHISYAVGGIAGGSYTSGSAGIYNCYNSGMITGTTGTGALGTMTGGIAGDLSGNINHCYNIGTVTVGQLNSIGGIVGKIRSGSILGNYFLTTAADSGIGIDTPGSNSTGTAVKTSTELNTKSTFEGWNFNTGPLCWVIDGSSNSGYPFISTSVPQTQEELNADVTAAKAALDDADFTLGNPDTTTSAITTDFTLPFSGTSGTAIAWSEITDTGSCVSLSGGTVTVTRPTSVQGDKTVTLRATITKGSATETKDFTFTIKATLAAPENLQITQTNGTISVEDDNLYMTFDVAQSWLQNLKGIVVTKDGGNNVEGTDKWTVTANRIRYRADGNIPDIATYDACGNFQLGNSDLFVKLALSGKDRICKTGSYTIKLMATGYDEETMTFSITYGNFYGMKVIDQPSGVTSGGNVGKVQVAAIDRFENVYTAIDGVHYSVVTASAKDSAFTLGGTSTAAFTTGIATFDGITATKAEGLTGAKLHFSVTQAGGGDAMIEENRPVLLAFAEPVSQTNLVVSDFGNQNGLGQFLPRFFAAGGHSQTYTCDSEAFIISAPAGGNGGGGGTKTHLTASNQTDIVVDGQKQGSAATVNTQTGSDGQTTKTVKLNDQRVQDILKGLSQDRPVITVPAEGGGDRVVGMLNGQTVSTMEEYQARLVIKTDTATYTLPSSEINIAEISKQFGGSVSLGDIDVAVTISEPSNSTVKIVENAAKEGGFSIAVPAVEFEVNCTYNNKTIAVRSFHSYVERLITIPSGVDPNKITTGIVVEPDGSSHHVPTEIIVIDGVHYAKINSLTNSVYSVIYNPIEFADVGKHWAKDAINDMGSRLVVNGIGNNNYDPSNDITRAEFAAIIVRALGLEPGAGNNSFSDVSSKNWYCEYTETAASYGLILGNSDGSFRPNNKITREQAMAIIARAMEITNLEASVESGKVSSLLSAYTDASKISGYAKSSAATCLNASIVNGTSSTSIDPKDYVTRAEVAVMMQRLLQKSDLI